MLRSCRCSRWSRRCSSRWCSTRCWCTAASPPSTCSWWGWLPSRCSRRCWWDCAPTVFSHTTNRIDVELGARLFRHLLALPLAYFESRRAGDSVARVRELENIRNFLTGSALTLVVDLVFTFVFLAVMLYYSPLLTVVVLAAFPLYIGLSAGLAPVFRRRLDEK